VGGAVIVHCGWCGQFQHEKEPFDDTRISHGICPPCAETHFGVPLSVPNESQTAEATDVL